MELIRTHIFQEIFPVPIEPRQPPPIPAAASVRAEMVGSPGHLSICRQAGQKPPIPPIRGHRHRRQTEDVLEYTSGEEGKIERVGSTARGR